MDRFNARWLAICTVMVLCCASVGAVNASTHKSLSRLKSGLESVRDSSEKAKTRLAALKKREKQLQSKLTEKIVPKSIPAIDASLEFVRDEIQTVPEKKPKALRKKLTELLDDGYEQAMFLLAGSTCSDPARLSKGDVRHILQEFKSKADVLDALEKIRQANQGTTPKTAAMAAAELKKIRFERKALLKKVAKCDLDEKTILAEIDVVKGMEKDEPEKPKSEYMRPLPGRITSGFGPRVHPLDHIEKNHQGIDFAGEIGDEVKSSREGKVIFAGEQRGYGKIVIVQHSEICTTAYAHLSELDVEVGEEVSQGQMIGLVGMTGNSTGPHLHFEIRENGEQVDPLKYI